MAFDPDKYLQKKSIEAFDPDAYLQEKEGYDYSDLGQVASDLVKVNVDALPQYGAAVGGLLGPAAAGLGSAAGESLRQGLYGVKELVTGERDLANEMRLPTQDELKQLALQQAGAFAQGYTGEAGGRLAAKGLQAASKAVQPAFEFVAENIRPPVQKANAADIIKAAKELGIDVTPGMLDDTGFVERLESSLAKSPSIFGQSVAKQLQAQQRGLQAATESTLEKASDLSRFELGEKFKSGVVADVAEKLDPLAATFQEVAESTRNIPLNEKSLAAVQRNASNLDMVQLGLGGGKAQQYIDAIPKLKNVDQVKTLMTALDSDFNAAQGAERVALGQIKEKLSRLEQNSIIRGAIQAARESGGAIRTKTGEKIGKEVVSDLQAARKGYRELSSGLQEVADTARFGQKRMSPNLFLSNVEGMTSENIPSKFFNLDDQRQLMALKERFPEQFELLRQGRLGEIYQKSVDNSLMGQGEINTQRFLNAFRKLSKETQEILFGENLSKIKNIETVQQSMPRNFNPSGTASSQEWQTALMTNVKDIPNYLLYKGASTNLAQNIGQALVKSPQMLDLSKSNPELFQQFVSQLTQSDKIQNATFGRSIWSNQQEVKPNQSIDKNRILEKTQGSKYSQVLQNAAQKGERSFNAAHYVLHQNNPEYRQMLKEEEQ
jgi:hypothetical protein